MTKNRIIAIILVLLVIDFGRILTVGLVSSAMTRPERHIIVVDQDGAGGVAMNIPIAEPSVSPKVLHTQLSNGISPAWPESIQQWGIWITKYAEQYSIDPDMVAAVMLQESGGQQNVTSVAGAEGLMQIMPFHSCATYKPEGNISCGVHLLGIFRQKAPDWRSALAAYNAGERGRDNGKGWGYADKVLALYNTHNQ